LSLTPGTRLGVFEITAQIGEGGMGQVYRATDTTLGRQVAMKILPDAFASDPERLARFEREAKTLASLNHPNIAAIYAVEKSGGMTALVMELVEGDDLSQRIARGAIPIDEALPMASVSSNSSMPRRRRPERPPRRRSRWCSTGSRS
jgi:serine/threonine protein kinase